MMQQDKLNNQWAGSGDSLQELPEGFHFNAQMVWNELERQLPAPAKKQRFVYYAAASVLIIAVAAFFLLTGNPPERSIVVASPGTEQTVKPTVEADKQQLVIHKKIDRKKRNDASTSEKAEMPLVKQEETAATIPVERKELPPEIQMELQPVPLVLEKKQSPKKIPVPVTAKQVPKLKIIHLNELSLGTKIELLSKQELKQIVQQQQIEQQEAAAPKENLKQVLYFKTVPRTNTSTTITDNH